MSLVAQASRLAKLNIVGRKILLPSDIREITGFVPRPLQAAMRTRMRRFNSRVLHRRAGKSVDLVNLLIERAVECPFDEGRYAYLAPTYDMAENIAWTYLSGYTENFPMREVKESRLRVTIPTRRGGRARISLYGVDTPKQRLRGLYLDGVVFDEWALIPPHVWTQQVRPMLSDQNRSGYDALLDRNQWAVFAFTPFGRNHAYKMHQRADMWQRGLGVVMGESDVDGKEGQTMFSNEWAAELHKASETGILSATELASARLDMEEDEYQQEYECSFDAAIKGAIFGPKLADVRAQGRVAHVPYNPLLPVHTAWDLGHDDCTAIWFVQCLGPEVRVIDFYEASGAGLDHYADILERRAYRYGKHYLPHDVEVVELGTNKSRASVLRGLGVRVTTVPRTKKDDSIAAGRALFARCWFDEAKTAEGLDRLALYRRDWDPNQQVFRQNPKHDLNSHSADAWQTLATGLKRFSPGHDEFQSASAEM